MALRKLVAAYCLAAVLSACGGGGDTPSPPLPPPTPTPAPQTIAFATSGTLNATVGSTANNVASGGGGTGAISYTSSNPLVATVDASGAATVLGIGTTTITAIKAADANFLQAQAAYTLNAQTATTISAFVGVGGAEVYLPATASGRQFGRARVADCGIGVTVIACSSAELSNYSTTAINDTRATTATPAYYALVNGSTVGTPIDVRAGKFSGRIGHAVVRFNNRYWVIGGGEPIFPSPGPNSTYVAKSDVWSSADGKAWKLETANGGFGTRWFHQAVVFDGRIWIISGANIPAQSPLPWYSDVWSSADGVNWTQESSANGLPWNSTTINAFVQNNELLVVSGGRIYRFSDTNDPLTSGFVRKTALSSDLTGTIGGRNGASLAFYNNAWWYIGGRPEQPITVPQNGTAMNDVWRSSDGVAWTLIKPDGPPSTTNFPARYRHNSFVLNNKLWVSAGIAATNGVDGFPSSDAWSTTDGITWTQENTNAGARGYLMPLVQEDGKATVFGGIQYAHANNVLQSTDGNTWNELSTNAQFSSRYGRAISFNGQMWMIGGISTTGSVTHRGTNEVWRSTDGANWHRVTTTGSIFSSRESHALAVHNGRLWLSGGANAQVAPNNTTVRFNDVWSTADGVSWRQETSAAQFEPRWGHAMLSYNNKLWVMAGSGAASYFNDVWSSTDGATWTLETSNAAFSPRTAIFATFNGAMWLIGGENPPTVIDDAWRSTDGITWTQQTMGAHYSPRSRAGLAVLNGRMYVIGGASNTAFPTSTFYNDVWSTADGTTWRAETLNAAFSPRSLVLAVPHNNELWFMGGLYPNGLTNEVWRSADGANWRIAYSNEITAP